MYTLIAGAVLNIILDYIFIFPLQMGIFGAALATGISKVVSATWIMLHFRVGIHRALTLHIRNLRLRWHLIRPMVAIGLSPFIIQLVASTVVIALNRQLLSYSGEVAVGAMGAMFSIMTLLNMPVWDSSRAASRLSDSTTVPVITTVFIRLSAPACSTPALSEFSGWLSVRRYPVF